MPMPRVSNRLDKINDLLKRELAQLVQYELRDPRVGMVSVTDVRVSRDLAYADVYVTVLGKSTSREAADSLEGLNHAAGHLRSLLAKNVNLRSTPRLKFVFDESVARGAYLSGLIEEALARDEREHDHSDNPADDGAAEGADGGDEPRGG